MGLSVVDLTDLTVNGQKGERIVAAYQHAAEHVRHAAGAVSLLYVRIPGPFIKSGENFVLLKLPVESLPRSVAAISGQGQGVQLSSSSSS